MAMLVQELELEERERFLARTLVGTAGTDLGAAHVDAIDGDPAVRTCAHCGEHVAFRIDPLGSWAECPICGHLA